MAARGVCAVFLRSRLVSSIPRSPRLLHVSRPQDPLAKAVEWRLLVDSTLAVWRARGRWIPHETVVDLLEGRPSVDPRTWFEGREAVLFAESLSAEEKAALTLMHQDLEARVSDVNESIFRSELHQRRQFFDSVESSPLTEEQIRAVVSFDNRVQVVASAGSGKTSVMVARAAYAIARDFVPPDRILLLAFNKAAAVELQERLEARLSKLGLSTEGLRASTFHSFGLDVIGRATGRKPRPAPWLDGGQDVGMVSRIVDELRDSSPSSGSSGTSSGCCTPGCRRSPTPTSTTAGIPRTAAPGSTRSAATSSRARASA